MADKIGTEASYLDAIAIEYDWIYLATQLDGVDPEEYRHTRMLYFDDYSRQVTGMDGWGYYDLNLHVVSVCVKKKTSEISRMLCALSREGDVEIRCAVDCVGTREKIPGAGLGADGSEWESTAGCVTNIREIGDSLYVCGMNGQLYRRPPEGGWLAIDGGLRKPLTAENHEISNYFTCIDGNRWNDVYVVGLHGVVYHFDGWNWQKVSVPTDEHLHWVRCYGENEIYICGNNGTLLKGSAEQGFKDVSGIEDNLTWWCLCKFQDKVYLSSAQGLYAWDGETIAPIVSGLQPELETWRVDSVDEKALWSFGTKDLAWFDGARWQRLYDPGNERVDA